MLQEGFAGQDKPWMLNAVRISPFNIRVSDVSVIHDLMIHDIDIALTLAGTEIVDVKACGHSVISGLTDVCQAMLTFRNGMVANLFAGRIFMGLRREMDIFYGDRHEHLDFQSRKTSIHYFQRGVILPSAIEAEMVMNWPDAEKTQSMWHTTKNYPENNAILSELTEFYESIANNKPVRVGISDAGKAMHTIALIEEAMNKTNQLQVFA
jgi:predicted dehydrogenase